MALQVWTIGLILSCFMLIAIDNYNVNGFAQRGANKEVSKIKCKEHVDEALRQYWDHEKRPPSEAISDVDNDDDSDDDDNKNVKYSKRSDDDDNDDDDNENDDSKEVECDEDNESDDKSKEDKDDDNDDDDNDDDDDDSKEKGKNVKSEELAASDESDENKDDDSEEENKSEVKDDDKSDDKDDDNKSAEDDDDKDEDNDDDDDDSDDDKDKESESEVKDKVDKEDKKKKRYTMTITYSKDTKMKVKPKSVAETQESKEKDDSDDDDDDHEDKDDVTVKKREADDNDEDDDDDDDERDDDKSETKKADTSDESDEDKSDDETAEKVESQPPSHVEDILRVYEIGSQEDTAEQNLILSIFRELKKIYETAIKPLEIIYKYRHITTRLITDAELFSKPMVLFLGSKSTGKTSLVNYLLGIDNTAWQLKTGLTRTYPHFTVLSYGENYTRFSPTELSADFTFSSLQQFGQHFLEQYIEAYRLPINLLQKMTIIDSPGLIDVIAKGGSTPQSKGIDNEVYQWFIDRSDVIYILLDVTQIHLSHQLQAIIEQLRGREVRFILSKCDVVSHSQLITTLGQLLWLLSPIMSAERPPQVYALTTIPQEVLDPFLEDQEVLWLKDLSEQISGISRIESRIAALRRHAVRVRNHAKLVDCYLATYYKNKGIFTFGASSRQLANDITENPQQYRIFSGTVAGLSQNISRYDLPDPGVYKEFFRTNPLFDFKPLTSTCSYFRGCPIDKLDIAIAYQLPELVGKYKKLTQMQPIV